MSEQVSATGDYSGRVVIIGSVTTRIEVDADHLPAAGETVAGWPRARAEAGSLMALVGSWRAAVAALGAGEFSATEVGAIEVDAAEIDDREVGVGELRCVAVGFVADDPEGAAALGRLRALSGIDVRVAVGSGAMTSTGQLIVERAGDRSTAVLVYGENAHGRPEDVDLDDIGAQDVVILGPGLQPSTGARLVRRCAARGARVVIAFADHPVAGYGELPNDVLALADPVVTSEAGMARLADAGTLPASVVTVLERGILVAGQSVAALSVTPLAASSSGPDDPDAAAAVDRMDLTILDVAVAVSLRILLAEPAARPADGPVAGEVAALVGAVRADRVRRRPS